MRSIYSTLNWCPDSPPGLLPGDNVMLFIFARQVRDMSLRPEAGIVMTAVTTSELNSAHNGGECQPAVTTIVKYSV